MIRKILMLSFLFAMVSCQTQVNKEQVSKQNIDQVTTNKVSETLKKDNPELNALLIEKGVAHAASLWRTSDGTPQDFEAFCYEQFIASAEEKSMVFAKLEGYFENLWGNFAEIGVGLNMNLALDNGPLHAIDQAFSSYSPQAHFATDFYQNKIAFVIALNFPYYSLEEKEALGKSWSDEEWAWARLGDVFASRVPAELSKTYASVGTQADVYVSQYNIFMGSIVNEQGEKPFPEDMVLLTHWNLRDEIKSNYANAENGLMKQQMVYQVMKRIIDQTIPKQVINSGDYTWDVANNKLYNGDAEVNVTEETDERYQQIINSFKVLKSMDAYEPALDTYIKRNFSGDMEISQEDVEALFHEFLSSSQVGMVAELIKHRLGRDLQAYDIWYDGFKARSSISADFLKNKTEKMYPDAMAFENDMDRMLVDLGWDKKRAEFIASKISVDAARGSGHALGAEMKLMNSRLRTRLPKTGMNYKGYNIAVHEFGHNVEQTISLHDVPYYSMNGVPNTAFTEALAFIFQSRDLQLLGINDNNADKAYLKTLDTFWSVYEIMGVSMVDMKVWKWLYANPEATASELKDAAISIAKEVWNTYYAEVFGLRDEPILAIYSHMIAYPLYLSAYSFGHLIDFQIEEYLKGKNFSDEVDRMYSLGRLTPQLWMERAVGEPISNKPLLQKAEQAVGYLKTKA